MLLTLLEKCWMKAMLLDSRMRLFEPDMTGLEDIKPLFMPDTMVYDDRYSDGDDDQNPAYVQRFHTILRTFWEKRNLYISFASRRRAQLRLVVPLII